MALFIGSDGVTKLSTKKTPKYKYRKANQFGSWWSDVAPAPKSEANIAAMLQKSEAAYKAYEKKFGKALLDKIALKMHGKKFRELDKESTLKNFKAKLDKYEDFIIENKRYPNQAEALQIGMQRAGNRKIGLGKSGITGNIKTFVDNTYSKGIGGSTYIAKELAKPPYNFKINSSNLRQYITEEVEAGRLKRPKKFKTQEATAPKDRYNIIREVTERDKRGFTVGSLGKKVLAPAWSTYKISFNTPRNPETTLVPKNYQGTQYFKTLGAAEKALEARGKLDLSRTDEAVRVVNKLIKADPDLANDIRTLAQEVYGAAEGTTDVLKEQDLERKMRSVATDVTRLQEQLSSKLQGFDTKTISKLVLPTGKAAEDILTDITVNTDIGRFGGTAIRNSRMRIISGILNERKGKFNSLRNAVTKFVASGRHLDEVAGIGATYDVAPGYASFAQSIPEKINLDKGKKIDLDFARLLRQAVTNQTGPKSFRNVKYNTLGEAINAYNKFSREFAKKEKIFTPTIEYSPGKELDPSKFAKNYTQLRPEAKANVLELAKKGIGIGVGEAQPFEYYRNLFKNANPKEQFKIAEALNCPLPGRADGGRIGYALGSGTVNCVNTKLVNETEIPKLTRLDDSSPVLSKMKNAATGFLGFAKKGGKYGAIAAAGAAGAGLVKTFMNDDPTTYLSNEDQQKNMLIDMITSPIDDTPEESPEILDYQLPTMGAVTAAGMIPGGKRLYDVRRRGGPKLKPAGPVRSALGLKGVLGKGLAATATPLGLAALEPLHIAGQVAQGDSLTDIATNPWNYLGPTFASGLTKEATRFTSPMVSKIMRMGMSPTALRGLSRFGGYGLAASLGIQGLQKFDDWRNKRGWFREE